MGGHALFAYGTLEFPQVMRALTGRRFRTSPACLKGHVRLTVRGAVYPGLTPRAGGEVSGTLYRGLDRKAIRRLDAFEGPLYRRRVVRVQPVGERSMTALVYLVTPRQRRRLGTTNWDPVVFAGRHLTTYLRRLRHGYPA